MKLFDNTRIVKDYLRLDYNKSTGALEEIRSVVTVEPIIGISSITFRVSVPFLKSLDEVKYKQDDVIIFPPTAKNILSAAEYYAEVAKELLRLEGEIVELCTTTNYIKHGKQAIEERMRALGFLNVLADNGTID